MIRKLALLLLLIAPAALAADYGRTTAGALRVNMETSINYREITVPGGETSVAIIAYLQTTNGSTANCKGAVYSGSNTLLYESSAISFVDDVGGWHSMPFTTAVPAGTYKLSIACGYIPGGLNEVSLAYDTVAVTSALGRYSGGAPSYPTLPATAVWDGPTNTQDISLYLQTSSGGGSTVPAKFYHYIRGKKQ